MTAMTTSPGTTLHVPVDGWTVDDLPDDADVRCELVDGALLVTPPPELRHGEVADELRQLLRAALPDDLRVLAEPGVFFDRRNYRVPDVVVYRRTASAKGRIEPADVVLAVEVMSPGSVSNDRVAKPALYAAAGIPHFWRLELDPLLLVTHELDGDAYRVQAFDDAVSVEHPVGVRFRLADLLT